MLKKKSLPGFRRTTIVNHIDIQVDTLFFELFGTFSIVEGIGYLNIYGTPPRGYCLVQVISHLPKPPEPP